MKQLKTLGPASVAGLLALLAACASHNTPTTAKTPMQPAATAAAPATGVAPQVSGTGSGAATATRADTRDWAQVDTNRDGLVSPEEMSAYLKANPATPKK